MNSIVEELSKRARINPEKIAVIADDESTISYERLWKEVQGFAEYLKEQGVNASDRVVVKSSHSIEYIISCLGVHLLGAINVPVESTLKDDGLDAVVKEVDASTVIANENYKTNLKFIDIAKVREISSKCAPKEEITAFPDTNSIGDILFTTGTTGKSKGVVISHRAIVAVCENVIYGVGITEENVYLVPVPINHASGIRKIYITIATGGTVVLCNGFTDMKKFFGFVEKFNVTSILMPPSAIRIMVRLGKRQMKAIAGQLDHIHTGTAPLAESDKEKLCELLPGVKLIFAYGSSEAGCCCLYDYSRYPGRAGCVGKANCNAIIRIVDDDRNPIESSVNNTGTLAISGKMTMEGYYNEADLTSRVFENGVVYTSDIGYIDEEGFVYVLGRKDDVINLGGLKIAPTEVEGIALQFNGISECVYYGKEDAKGTLSINMDIVLEGDAQFDEKIFMDFLCEKLEAFKVPKKIHIVKEIHKTANGKINRKMYKNNSKAEQ